MSKRINVNPDHYKTGGSLHQGDDVVQRDFKRQFTEERAQLERWQAAQKRKEELVEQARESEQRQSEERAEEEQPGGEGEPAPPVSEIGESPHVSSKSGKQSGRIKEDASRYDLEKAPVPSTAPVPGAHGKVEERPRDAQPRRLLSTDKARAGRKKKTAARAKTGKTARKKTARKKTTGKKAAGTRTARKKTTRMSAATKKQAKKTAGKKTTRNRTAKKTARKKK